MAVSSKEIETLWKRYSDEGSKKGVSVAEFFESNGVPYHTFEKWYRRKFQQPDIVECTVVGGPSSEMRQQPSREATSNEISKSPAVSYVCINLSNGVKIEHRKMSYPELLCFISKLEGLCSL